MDFNAFFLLHKHLFRFSIFILYTLIQNGVAIIMIVLYYIILWCCGLIIQKGYHLVFFLLLLVDQNLSLQHIQNTSINHPTTSRRLITERH